MKKHLLATAFLCMANSQSYADFKVVTWNVQAELYESLPDRIANFREFGEQVEADVIVLVEANGEEVTKAFAEALGWEEYYSITSDLGKLSSNVFFALEMSVVSKIPIERVIEYDANVDGVHSVLRNGVAKTVEVDEVKLSSDGIAGFGSSLHWTDRGSIRVDLANGLSLFPVHLKSNRVPSCDAPKDALEMIEESGFELSGTLRQQLATAETTGSNHITAERKLNAVKRERVMAAVVREAGRSITEDQRIPVILGDFNTAFEPGKYGNSIEDCDLQNFSCDKQPFPASACAGGDGFDDTLGMMEAGLVGPVEWSVLSKELKSTYDDDSFSDLAIDHIAVPVGDAQRFSDTRRVLNFFGSDHYPVITTFDE